MTTERTPEQIADDEADEAERLAMKAHCERIGFPWSEELWEDGHTYRMLRRYVHRNLATAFRRVAGEE